MNESPRVLPRLVMLPGWSMHADVLMPLVDASPELVVEVLELPGYCAEDLDNASLWRDEDALIHHLLDQLPEGPVVLVGWSLGGALSLSMAAAAPERIEGLVLLATNPCFVEKPQWPGMPPEIFAEFSAGIDQNTVATLRKFRQLCCVGSSDKRALTRWLRDLPLYSGDDRALSESLQWLLKDFSGNLFNLQVPCLNLLAADDALVPVGMASQLPGTTTILPGCSHLLFTDHPAQVAGEIRDFVATLGAGMPDVVSG